VTASWRDNSLAAWQLGSLTSADRNWSATLLGRRAEPGPRTSEVGSTPWVPQAFTGP